MAMNSSSHPKHTQFMSHRADNVQHNWSNVVSIYTTGSRETKTANLCKTILLSARQLRASLN